MLEKQCYIPEPEEFIAETPLPEALKKLKRERDEEVKAVVAGKSDKMLMIVGPCSAHESAPVLEYISPKLEEAESSSQAREILAAELDNIRETAQAVSEGRGVTVTLTRENYPTKSYEGFTLPAGEYESLRVILGEGQGHNWWCIVFPPVCLSAAQADTVEEQLGEEDFRLISEDGGYELRFRALELWGELVEKLG